MQPGCRMPVVPSSSTGSFFGPAGRMRVGKHAGRHGVCSGWLRLRSAPSLHMYNSSPVYTSCDSLGYYLQRIIFDWEMMNYFDPSVHFDILPNEELRLVENVNKRSGPRPNIGL